MRLKDETFSRIYSSDLNRTVQTVSQISVHHPDISNFLNKIIPVEVQLDPRLREKGGGILEGMPLNTFKIEA